MPVKPPLPTHSKAVARKLRQAMTDAELALWYRLRGGRLAGLRFRRQHPVPPYVVDFFCAEARLVVELDGSQHTAEVDDARTRSLEQQGMVVLRFWDNQVFENLDGVLRVILDTSRVRTLTRPFGAPSPEGRGEKQ